MAEDAQQVLRIQGFGIAGETQFPGARRYGGGIDTGPVVRDLDEDVPGPMRGTQA